MSTIVFVDHTEVQNWICWTLALFFALHYYSVIKFSIVRYVACVHNAKNTQRTFRNRQLFQETMIENKLDNDEDFTVRTDKKSSLEAMRHRNAKIGTD